MRDWPTLLLASVLGLTTPVQADLLGDMVRDGTGRIWAIHGRELAWLEGDAWPSATDQALDGASASSLNVLRDGTLVCLWSFGGRDVPRSVLTRQKGDAPAQITNLPVALKAGRVLARDDGSLLITEQGPAVVELPLKGDPRVTTMPEDFFKPGPGKDFNGQRQYASVRATEDGQHHVWLWASALSVAYNARVLRNLVSYEDGQVKMREVPELDLKKGISGLLSGDEHHLWLAKVGAGIYALDLETFQSELITTPLPKRNDTDNVQYIEQLFSVGSERFALTCPQPDEAVEIKNVPKINSGAVVGIIKHYRENEPTGRLLHYQSGKWVEILAGIDSRPWYNTYDRPHLLTSAGLLIGSRYSGPWLVQRPQDQPPIHLDWTTNFPLSDARQFIAEGEAQIRAVSSQGRMALASIEPPLRTSPLRCQEFTLDLPLLGDADGNLWGFRGRKFSQWNGESWSDHDMPLALAKNIGNARWWLDDRGRGWVLMTGGKAGYCDFATGAWKVFDSWDEAFVAQLPGGMNLPNLNDPFLSPVYSGHGQIAYLTLENGFHFYDGKSWHKWLTNEIGGEASVIDGGPFFEGQELCLPLSGATMAWDDSKERWNRRDRKEPPKLTIKQDTGAPIPVPDGSPVEKPQSIAQDALGVTWFTSAEGRLYKAVGGRAIPVLADDEPNPFRYGWEITRPKIDARGNVIFEQRNWYYPYHFILVKAAQPLPKVTANLKELAGDQARVQFSSDVQPPAEIWYSWQLDQGDWQPLQHRPEALLRSLAPGPHRLQVRAYNGELGPARTPAAVDFTIEARAKSDPAPAPK